MTLNVFVWLLILFMDILMYSLGAASKVLGKIKQINLHRLRGLWKCPTPKLSDELSRRARTYPGRTILSARTQQVSRRELPICRGKTSRWSARKHAMQTWGWSRETREWSTIKRKGVALSLLLWLIRKLLIVFEGGMFCLTWDNGLWT